VTGPATIILTMPTPNEPPPPGKATRVRLWSENTLIRWGQVIGAFTLIVASGVYVIRAAWDAFPHDPAPPSVAEKVTNRFYVDAGFAPWAGKPRPLNRSHSFLEVLVETGHPGWDPRRPESPNVKGETTFDPDQAALEAALYTGETIGIARGILMSAAAVRQTGLAQHVKGEGATPITMVVAQIGEAEPGREGSVFCEFPLAVNRQFGAPPGPRVGTVVEAEGVPIMIGTATGNGGGRGVAAYFVCNGVRRMRTLAEQ
jgi:hypothetical protein